MSLKMFLLQSPLRPVWNLVKRILQIDRKRCQAFFRYDEERFWHYSGVWREETKETALAKLTMNYHVMEKGLTMPEHRLGFGMALVAQTMSLCDVLVSRFGKEEFQVRHAVGVVKAYYELHRNKGFVFEEDFRTRLEDFVMRYEGIPSAQQYHVTREDFYSMREAPFPSFALARHTVRHFKPRGSVPLEKIERAVEIARTSPSACNRQHGRVHCICHAPVCRQILELQGGNRGFGHLADKVLIVTADLHDILLPRERNDAFVNGGIFLMNLCYALFYEEIAHCILTWAQTPETDRMLREIVGIPDSEVVIALVACGEPPAEFDVAASPRRPLNEVLRVV